jgi:predicted nucleic acid-binding protein
MNGVTYDTGALIAADRGASAFWQRHIGTRGWRIVPTVPACVLAEAWRGGPQAGLSRLLTACHVEPFTEADARRLGAFAAKLKGVRASVVDVLVVEGALRRGDVVVTSDPDDLRAIARAAGRRLAVELV